MHGLRKRSPVFMKNMQILKIYLYIHINYAIIHVDGAVS